MSSQLPAPNRGMPDLHLDTLGIGDQFAEQLRCGYHEGFVPARTSQRLVDINEAWRLITLWAWGLVLQVNLTPGAIYNFSFDLKGTSNPRFFLFAGFVPAVRDWLRIQRPLFFALETWGGRDDRAFQAHQRKFMFLVQPVLSLSYPERDDRMLYTYDFRNLQQQSFIDLTSPVIVDTYAGGLLQGAYRGRLTSTSTARLLDMHNHIREYHNSPGILYSTPLCKLDLSTLNDMCHCRDVNCSLATTAVNHEALYPPTSSRTPSPSSQPPTGGSTPSLRSTASSSPINSSEASPVDQLRFPDSQPQSASGYPSPSREKLLFPPGLSAAAAEYWNPDSRGVHVFESFDVYDQFPGTVPSAFSVASSPGGTPSPPWVTGSWRAPSRSHP